MINNVYDDESLIHVLNNILEEVFIKLNFDTRYAQVHPSSRSDLCQFQCNAAMALSKRMNNLPMEIAKVITNHIQYKNIFIKINVVEPGFININLTDEFLAISTNKLFHQKIFKVKKNPKKVIIDFGGANVAKTLHIGHIRSLLIGDCLQRVFRLCGDNVVSDIHLGDWGTQIGILIEKLKNTHDYINNYDTAELTIEKLTLLYPEAVKECKNDHEKMQNARLTTAKLQKGHKNYKEIWNKIVNISVKVIRRSCDTLKINFNLWKSESDTRHIIQGMIKDFIRKGYAEYDMQTVIMKFKQEKDNIPPLILAKSDGATMYSTTDLATIVERVKIFSTDKIIYIVDKRQKLHFQQVFKAAKIAHLVPNTELIHIGFGTINDTDGKPFKTRGGDIISLDTLITNVASCIKIKDDKNISEREKNNIIDKITLAVIKFSELSNACTSDHIFDIKKMLKYEGKTGLYLLYSAIRIKSILQKVNIRKIMKKMTVTPANNEIERTLQIKLLMLPNIIAQVYEKYHTHLLCEHVYQLATIFNKFYANLAIINEPSKDIMISRIGLCIITLKQLEIILQLLGIQIPEKI